MQGWVAVGKGCGVGHIKEIFSPQAPATTAWCGGLVALWRAGPCPAEAGPPQAPSSQPPTHPPQPHPQECRYSSPSAICRLQRSASRRLYTLQGGDHLVQQPLPQVAAGRVLLRWVGRWRRQWQPRWRQRLLYLEVLKMAI